MTARRMVAAAIAAMMLAGCATQPADVAPTHVSGAVYDGHDCAWLAREADGVGQQLASAEARLKGKADRDAGVMAVGMILFWPALFALGGNGGLEADVANLKGQQQAIQTAQRRAGCEAGKP